MISHIRVDNRLIHGQTVLMWTRVIKTDRIVLISNSVASNPNQVLIMEMVSPPGLEVSVINEDAAKEQIKNNFFGDESVFVVTPSLHEIEFLINNGADISEIFLGNQAFAPGKKKLTRNVALDNEEIKIVKNILAQGKKVTIQTLPAEKSYDASKLID